MAPIDYFLHKPNYNRIMCLALDDFDEEPPIGQAVDPVKAKDLTSCNLAVNELFKGEWDFTKNDLYKMLVDNSCEHELNFLYFSNSSKIKKIDYNIVFYIFKILMVGDKIGLSNISENESHNDVLMEANYTHTMLALARKVHFWLGEKDEDSPSMLSKSIYPGIEYFGYYNSSNIRIIVYPKRIDDAVEKLQNQQCVLRGYDKEEARKILYAIVIIHLLAQALMDSTNRLFWEDMSGSNTSPVMRLDKKENSGQKLYEKIESSSHLLMEKSLANMITLSYFNAFSEQFQTCDYKAVRELISIQPDAYKFGILQYDYLKPNWKIWRESKKNFAVVCKK